MYLHERMTVMAIVLVIIVGFTSGVLAGGLASNNKLYQPSLAIGAASNKLCIPQGSIVHQVVKTPEGGYVVQTIGVSDPASPFLKGRVALPMSSVQEALLYRNRLYILGSQDARRLIQVVNVDDNVPKLITAVTVQSDAKAIARSKSWLGVIGENKFQIFDLDKPDQPQAGEIYFEPNGNFAAIKMKAVNAYIVSHTVGQFSRIINFRIRSGGKISRVTSVPVNPYATELYVFDEFNDGFVLAMGTLEPRVYETYYQSKPKLEIKSYFDAFVITNDNGNLRSIPAPALSDKEMMVSLANDDSSGQLLYMATQRFAWNQQQGQFTTSPFIKQFEATTGGFRQLSVVPTRVMYPRFLQQTGQGLFVFGQDFDGVNQLEVFTTR